MRLIGGQLVPAGGYVKVDGQVVHALSRDALYQLRRKMGMQFQAELEHGHRTVTIAKVVDDTITVEPILDGTCLRVQARESVAIRVHTHTIGATRRRHPDGSGSVAW